MKPRILGLENEYGLIFSPNGRIYLPIEKILGYIFEGLIPNSWPSNAFLVNGARFYQDTGCHPEYSTPECDNIEDLVVHDKAGERLLEACLPAAEERLREEGLSGEIYIFKNNTDSLGNTYGCHENFLMRRDVDFWKVTEQLIPFFVTRQILAGAGKVLKVSGKAQLFLSQRAQHIHEKTSSSTTSSRSIINTRDEPHADAEKYRRLHIIVGDSNMSEIATYLKVGTAALVLSMIEDGYAGIFADPQQVIFPGIAVALTMLSFTFVGDGLRDAERTVAAGGECDDFPTRVRHRKRFDEISALVARGAVVRIGDAHRPPAPRGRAGGVQLRLAAGGARAPPERRDRGGGAAAAAAR